MKFVFYGAKWSSGLLIVAVSFHLPIDMKSLVFQREQKEDTHVNITSFQLPINYQATAVLPTPAFPNKPCALPLTVLYPFLAPPQHCKVCMLSLHLENRILEYNSSLGCHLGYYFPLFKTLETRHRINAVVVIGEELVITVPCQKVVSYF